MTRRSKATHRHQRRREPHRDLPSIVIDGRQVPVHLKEHHAARRYTLRVSRRDGAVHVTMPKGADRCQAISLVAANLEFIGRERNRLAPPVPFAPGALVPVEGKTVTLLRGGDKGPATRYDPERRELAVKGEGNRFAWRTEQWLRESARQRLIDQCAHYSELVGLAPCRISLRDPKTRWGSCSTSGMLSFSWRLILAPPEILGYVAAHETVHRVHFNHSKAFWALLYDVCPGGPDAEAWLRDRGSALFAYGQSQAAETEPQQLTFSI